MSEAWLDDEVWVVLDSYFAMLDLERQETLYQKMEHRQRVEKMLPGRSAKSIEFKWCNVSAVLQEAGLPWIPGYKPLAHYQMRLRELVAIWLLDHQRLSRGDTAG